MKILHLSESGLPDWRIEKSAQTGSKNGHDVFFAGGDSINYNKKIFSEIYQLKWSLSAKMGLWIQWIRVKKQLKAILEKVRPDIVHAHNVFSAKLMSEFDIPFVFDNHEYWSMFSTLLDGIKQFQKPIESNKDHFSSIYQNLRIKAGKSIAQRRAIKLWAKWEKELTYARPTIMVSERIAEEFRDKNTKNFVVPNFPMSWEVSDLKNPEFFPNISSIYAGGDGKTKIIWPNRDFEGITEVFEKNEIGNLTIVGWKDESTSRVKYVEFLPRREMYEEMTKHSIGLLPWKKHWTQCYLSPNKPYEYAHAGLLVFCTSTFDSVIKNLQHNCITFEDYSDLASKIKYFRENPNELFEKRKKSFVFSRENLIWEKNEKNILEAYRLC